MGEEAGAPVSPAFIRNDWRKAINEGCKNALHNGPVLGFPVHNVRIILKNLVASGGRLNPALLSACASECVTEALKKAGTHLIEPIMLAEIDVVDEAADQGVHNVLQELNRRRGTILNVTPKDTKGHHILVEAHVPLSETTGLSNAIRSLTSGLGTLHLQIHDFKHVSPQDQAAIIEKYYHRKEDH
uniref:Elongation factor EFG domain-containing protein n=1 Tax=Panagrolaimus superbus TaxID=310955 RepID=A0A914Y821_9BILA